MTLIMATQNLGLMSTHSIEFKKFVSLGFR